MFNLGLWGVRAVAFLTGWSLSDISNWFTSGDEEVGSSVAWLVTGLIGLIIGLVAYLIWDKKK